MLNEEIKKKIEIVVRQASAADYASVVKLYNHLHESEFVDLASPDVQYMWQKIIDDGRIHCFVANLEGNIVGTCLIDIVPNLTRGARPFAVLQNVVTHKDFRGQGIGSILNKYAIEFAWSSNCYQVLVQTGKPKAISFYENLGFRKDKVGLVAKPEWTAIQP